MILCKIRADYVREARCIISVFPFKQEANNITSSLSPTSRILAEVRRLIRGPSQTSDVPRHYHRVRHAHVRKASKLRV
jgi:hypothetical protein